jgi:hypothetical protein
MGGRGLFEPQCCSQHVDLLACWKHGDKQTAWWPDEARVESFGIEIVSRSGLKIEVTAVQAASQTYHINVGISFTTLSFALEAPLD